MVAEQAERRQAHEAEATRPLVVVAVKHLGDRPSSPRAGSRERPPESALRTRSVTSACTSLASSSAVVLALLDPLADVAVAATAQQLLFIAEVPEHEVVAARARVDVPEQLAKEAPRARGEHRVGR